MPTQKMANLATRQEPELVLRKQTDFVGGDCKRISWIRVVFRRESFYFSELKAVLRNRWSGREKGKVL